MLEENGLLLDLHPIPPSMHAFSEGRDLGVVDERRFFTLVRATERELERTVRDGLFALEAETHLEVIERFETVDDVFETIAEWENIRLSKRVAARIKCARPPVDFHERLVLRRYRRTRPRAAPP
jgi:hypothetical protein